jgi:hypothetical protein
MVFPCFPFYKLKHIKTIICKGLPSQPPLMTPESILGPKIRPADCQDMDVASRPAT